MGKKVKKKKKSKKEKRKRKKSKKEKFMNKNIVFSVTIFVGVFIILITHFLYEVPVLNKLNDRQGPFKCFLTSNQIVLKNLGQVGKSKDDGNYYKMKNKAIVLNNFDFQNKTIFDFQNKTIELRKICIGKNNKCEKNNWFINDTVDCYYRPHKKLVFWKNMHKTPQQYDYIVLCYLLPSCLIFFTLSLGGCYNYIKYITKNNNQNRIIPLSENF